MSDRPLPPRALEAVDALLQAAPGADAPLDEALLDEALLDALAEALADAQAPGPAPAPAGAPDHPAPDGWDLVAARLHLPTPPPGADIDWGAVAAAYVRPSPIDAATTGAETAAAPAGGPPGTVTAAHPAPSPQGRRSTGWGRWAALAGGGLLSAAVALFVLRPTPWTIHPDELAAPRIPLTVRGEAAAGPTLQALAPGPGPQPAGLIRLRLQVQSARAVDQASVRLRSLRGEGRPLDPAEGPVWTRPGELQVGLRLPPGVHPIEISVLDDLQREGTLVVELEVREDLREDLR